MILGFKDSNTEFGSWRHWSLDSSSLTAIASTRYREGLKLQELARNAYRLAVGGVHFAARLPAHPTVSARVRQYVLCACECIWWVIIYFNVWWDSLHEKHIILFYKNKKIIFYSLLFLWLFLLFSSKVINLSFLASIENLFILISF